MTTNLPKTFGLAIRENKILFGWSSAIILRSVIIPMAGHCTITIGRSLNQVSFPKQQSDIVSGVDAIIS